MKSKLFALLTMVLLGVVGVLFINATNNDYQKEVGGKHQIKGYKVVANSQNESIIEFNIARSSSDKVNPSVKTLSEQDLVYQGEGQVIDPTLGKYRVQLTFTDTRLQKELVKQLGLKKKDLSSSELLKSIKVAYPPDDSLMVIYLGFDSKPQVNVEELEDKLVVKLTK